MSAYEIVEQVRGDRKKAEVRRYAGTFSSKYAVYDADTDERVAGTFDNRPAAYEAARKYVGLD